MRGRNMSYASASSGLSYAPAGSQCSSAIRRSAGKPSLRHQRRRAKYPAAILRAYSGEVRALLLVAAAAAALAVVLGASAGPGGPTYYRDVAPILDAKCTSCHHLGGIAPFALTGAADARA